MLRVTYVLNNYCERLPYLVYYIIVNEIRCTYKNYKNNCHDTITLNHHLYGYLVASKLNGQILNYNDDDDNDNDDDEHTIIHHNFYIYLYLFQ